MRRAVWIAAGVLAFLAGAASAHAAPAETT